MRILIKPQSSMEDVLRAIKKIRKVVKNFVDPIGKDVPFIAEESSSVRTITSWVKGPK